MRYTLKYDELFKEEYKTKIEDFFKYKNWVVAGSVLSEDKYASKILKALIGAGYHTQGVNPNDTTGETNKSLKDVKFNIEVIDLCINSKMGLEVLKEARDMNINKVLIQPGAQSAEILKYCNENEITAIEGCALVELVKLN